MNSPIITKEKVRINITDEILSLTFKVGTVLGAVIGLWAVSYFITALIHVGPVQLARGYLTAITGL